jgi:transposase-like protein
MIWLASELATEQQCLDFAETIRWPRGVRCVHCRSPRVFKFVAKEIARRAKRADGRVETVVAPARQLYQCVEFGHQFTVTTGTALHDTHLPLVKWFFAIALMINTKGAVTARQLQRDLHVSYKTAWYLSHRIRDALGETPV